jgi:hypothetical protein
VKSGAFDFKIYIAATKEVAIQQQKRNVQGKIRVYTDGSGYEGGVRAAAVLQREGQRDRVLKMSMGKSRHQTVFNAKIVGIRLGAQLIGTERQSFESATIGVDSQAVIRATKRYGVAAEQGLLEALREELSEVQQWHGGFKCTIE